MRKEYYDLYRSLFEEYEFGLAPFYPFPWRFRLHRRFASEIADAIDEMIESKKLRQRVRPDAKYFLLVNLHQMIAIPYLFAFEPVERYEKGLGDLRNAFRHDIDLILSSAVDLQKTGGRSNEEISAHDIIRSIDRSWKELMTAKFDIWG
jgi:hypothetical protein